MPDERFFTTEKPINVRDVVAAFDSHIGKIDGAINRVAAPNETDLKDALIYCADRSTPELLQGKSFGLCLTTKEP